MALARPNAESNQPTQRIMTNSVSMTSVSPAPHSVSNSVSAPLVASPLRTGGASVNPGTQSKLAGTNGISAVKTSSFSQSTPMQSTQEEGSQDKQVEQAKLVRSFFKCAILNHYRVSRIYFQLPFTLENVRIRFFFFYPQSYFPSGIFYFQGESSAPAGLRAEEGRPVVGQ